MGDAGARDAGGSNGGSPLRMVPEEDLKKERERWVQTSMRQVWELENMASERIASQIQEAVGQLQNEAVSLLLPRFEAERSERVVAMAELREQLQAQRAAVDAELSILRTSLATRGAGLSLEAPNDQPSAGAADVAPCQSRRELEAEQGRLQALAAESAIRDLRSDLGLRADQQEAAHGQLRQDLRREVERIRGELGADRRQAEEQAVQRSRMEASVGDLRSRVEETTRELGELRQDQLSQTTVLQSRVEAAVGDREEHQSHIDSMRLIMREEQGRRSAEGAALRQVEAIVGETRGRIDELSVLPSRIGALEAAFKDTSPRSPDSSTAPGRARQSCPGASPPWSRAWRGRPRGEPRRATRRSCSPPPWQICAGASSASKRRGVIRSWLLARLLAQMRRSGRRSQP
ncbi:unnamed protein product [Prorocentrum cordatum]|uniref:Uncharacterized protein n=1 Tax=Prorocentrum cordatum TaxID=2364126 RepID=A0ABN9S671_9DINO|nr:unnamed protein product [Polarella glacialis]